MILIYFFYLLLSIFYFDLNVLIVEWVEDVVYNCFIINMYSGVKVGKYSWEVMIYVFVVVWSRCLLKYKWECVDLCGGSV